MMTRFSILLVLTTAVLFQGKLSAVSGSALISQHFASPSDPIVASNKHMHNYVHGIQGVTHHALRTSPTLTTSKSSEDGTGCAVCTILVGVLEQYIEVHNSSVVSTLEKVCDLFPNKTKDACELAVKIFGPQIIDNLEKKYSADRVCQELSLCSGTCRLFPATQADITFPFDIGASSLHPISPQFVTPGICNISVLKPICDAFYNWGNNNEPLDDKDGDGFSPLATFRGADWRGKDCDDTRADIHPGAIPINSDREIDSNCNGIFGVAADGTPYEEKFCGKDVADTIGTVVLGDSASAHFHIPPNFLTAQNIDGDTFKNLLEIIENEADWPMFSATTAFDVNDSRFEHDITGPVNSTYMTIRNRNRCIHRDYQNIAVNGARSGAMNDHIQQTLSRNQTSDRPVALMYALIGNDVCNGHIDDYVNHMTTPEEMRSNVLGTLDYLDKTLPNGSHVTLMGLAEGSLLYDSMHDQIHPLGKLHNDITYSQVYDYLNCLKISPCGGWLTTNATLRNLTQTRANELSDVLRDVVGNATKSDSYQNFDIYYFPNPIAFILNEWVAKGGEMWQLIEPVDGFHPNQYTQPLVVEQYFKWAAANDYNALIPDVNPYNADIEAQFGNQGGYL
jgi:acyloxyacyl hydrolase